MKRNINLGAIILAAGRGKRMNSGKTNKVAMHVGNKPLILHSVELLEKINFNQIIIVVGFAKESVLSALKKKYVVFAEQEKQLGTANAVSVALLKLDTSITDVLVIQGDDSHFYKEQIISKLLEGHLSKNADLTLLTIDVDNSFGLGRIVKDSNKKIKAIIEEKDATSEIRKINEINPACYVFKVSFLKKYLPLVEKSKATQEFYLTSLIDIAIRNKEKIETMRGGSIPWRGINTKEELQEAEKLHKAGF